MVDIKPQGSQTQKGKNSLETGLLGPGGSYLLPTQTSEPVI